MEKKYDQRSVRDGSPVQQRLNRTVIGGNRIDILKGYEQDDSKIVERMKLDIMDKDRRLTRLEIERQNFQL